MKLAGKLSTVVIEVVEPLCMMKSLEGYLSRYMIFWFLKALVMIKRSVQGADRHDKRLLAIFP